MHLASQFHGSDYSCAKFGAGGKSHPSFTFFTSWIASHLVQALPSHTSRYLLTSPITLDNLKNARRCMQILKPGGCVTQNPFLLPDSHLHCIRIRHTLLLSSKHRLTCSMSCSPP